ncbi:hypothetical protein GCM10020254_12820 [Streptomyces goshikiensis]
MVAETAASPVPTVTVAPSMPLPSLASSTWPVTTPLLVVRKPMERPSVMTGVLKEYLKASVPVAFSTPTVAVEPPLIPVPPVPL